MSAFEYQVVPAPRKGKAGKGVKGAQSKFAFAITELMNEMGSQGWEYMRADTLPCEERQGLTSKTVKYHSMLVFRRSLAANDPASLDPALLALEHYEDKLEDYADLEEPSPELSTELTAEPETHIEPSTDIAEAAAEEPAEATEDQARA